MTKVHLTRRAEDQNSFVRSKKNGVTSVGVRANTHSKWRQNMLKNKNVSWRGSPAVKQIALFNSDPFYNAPHAKMVNF